MTSLKSFEHKSIYLAPHSPMTLALKSYLKSKNIEIKGFIDKNKKDTNIKQIENISDAEFDYILILSPNHFDAIASEYLKYISRDKIIKVSIDGGRYMFESDFTINKREFAYIPKNIEFDRKKVVFISKGFVGANNKALYLYCVKNGIETTILTDNNKQIDELKKHDLPCEILDTKEADYEIAIAKYIIFDQGNYTYLPPLHSDQKTLQLWHGVGLKKMNRLEHITYDYFISTSKWTNETNFEHIFSAKEFLNLGYPRNDIFYRDEDELDLLFCDRKIYDLAKNSSKKVMLYMPTHRENRTDLNLDLARLEQKLQQVDAILILKLHPFVLEHYKSSKKMEFSHIYSHDAHGDIYPILKYVDTLISDYSSVVYDFLLLDKRVIFYNYDIAEYTKNVPLLFDYDEFSSGEKAKDQDGLESLLVADDTFARSRAKIRDLFFDKIAQGVSSQNIIEKMLKG